MSNGAAIWGETDKLECAASLGAVNVWILSVRWNRGSTLQEDDRRAQGLGHAYCQFVEGHQSLLRLRGEYLVVLPVAGGVKQLTHGRYRQDVLKLRAGGSQMPHSSGYPWEARHQVSNFHLDLLDIRYGWWGHSCERTLQTLITSLSKVEEEQSCFKIEICPKWATHSSLLLAVIKSLVFISGVTKFWLRRKCSPRSLIIWPAGSLTLNGRTDQKDSRSQDAMLQLVPSSFLLGLRRNTAHGDY